ncbi:hypothetical protein Bca52824_001146 [Brassica carinata]|uniref:DUF1985 domain-containing protein n=1 Tax=Brassica carinata TaxID=52824 RepID=A0A8X7WI84_BRACI|nr:hypothetical protein Bca52824_001146 [Brassica carinata]
MNCLLEAAAVAAEFEGSKGAPPSETPPPPPPSVEEGEVNRNENGDEDLNGDEELPHLEGNGKENTDNDEEQDGSGSGEEQDGSGEEQDGSGEEQDGSGEEQDGSGEEEQEGDSGGEMDDDADGSDDGENGGSEEGEDEEEHEENEGEDEEVVASDKEKRGDDDGNKDGNNEGNKEPGNNDDESIDPEKTVDEELDEDEVVKPTRMFFYESEYKKQIKLGTRCMIAEVIETFFSLTPEASDSERRWFEEHPQFCHLFHNEIDAKSQEEFNRNKKRKKSSNHKVQGMWMLLLRTVDVKKRREAWFVVNGVPTRYGLREHALISGLNCRNYPLGYKDFGDYKFVRRHFKNGESMRLEDVKAKLLAMGGHRDRLKMMVLFFLGSVCAQTKVGHGANDVLDFFQRDVDDLGYCKTFPWGRYSFDYMVKEISHTIDHFGGLVKEKTLWPLPGFCIPLEPQDIDSILPVRNDEEKALLDDVWEEDDDEDGADRPVDNWVKRIKGGYTVFFEDMYEADIAVRTVETNAEQAALKDIAPVEEVAEQKKMLEDLVKKVESLGNQLQSVLETHADFKERLASAESSVNKVSKKRSLKKGSKKKN